MYQRWRLAQQGDIIHGTDTQKPNKGIFVILLIHLYFFVNWTQNNATKNNCALCVCASS